MNRPLVFSLALIQLVSLSGSAAGQKTMAQHWNETGLTLEKLVLAKDCNENFVSFRACMAGVDSLARSLKPAERVLPETLIGRAGVKQGAVGKSFGAVALVRIPVEEESKANLRLAVKEAREDLRRLDLAVKELFDRGAEVRFGALQAELTARLKADPANAGRLAMIAGAAENAILQSVDAHASLQPSSYVREQREAPDKVFYGIGVMLETVGASTVVGKILSGGPAHRQKKLKKNDVILAVDGVAVAGKDPGAVADLIRSQDISNVVLRVLRGQEELDLTILRGKVETKNVETKIVTDLRMPFGYLKLSSFMDERGCDKIADGIRKMRDRVRGFIVDLRGNGGGLLDQGLCLGGLFLGDAVVVGVKDLESSSMDWLRSSPQTDRRSVVRETRLPVAVLIDGFSASASEILAGALQDYKRAWIVGETSFGKASVQSLRPDMRPGIDATLGKTTARFYQPTGRTNQVVGIQPDFVVPFKPNATEDERFVRREGDIYLNALPPEGARWKQTRPETVAKLQKCIGRHKRALTVFNATDGEENEADYQLLTAQELLRCGL